MQMSKNPQFSQYASLPTQPSPSNHCYQRLTDVTKKTLHFSNKNETVHVLKCSVNTNINKLKQ